MIEINLSSGQGKKGKKGGAKGGGRAGRASSGGRSFSLNLSGVFAKVTDPFLWSAIGGVGLSLATVAFMFTTQEARANGLAEAETKAVQDSTRYAAVIRDRRRAEAQRDSILKQLDVIRAIDDQRYIWPHLMDEVSKTLPIYTWITSVGQTSPVQMVVADSTRQAGDSAAPPPLKFRLTGQTVDIQALTRYMRLLEASPFIEHVQLARSEAVLVEGKQVTEFHLDAEWQRPDPTLLRMAPVSLSVR
jgi:Tfp pilus assembly protein PilN